MPKYVTPKPTEVTLHINPNLERELEERVAASSGFAELQAALNEAMHDAIRRVRDQYAGHGDVDQVYADLVSEIHTEVPRATLNESRLRTIAQAIVDGELED